MIPEVQTLCLSYCQWRPRFIQRLPFLSPRNILFTYLFTYPVRRTKINTDTDMKIILILFSFCLAVEIEGEKIGETSRKSRSRNRTDRDKRKLEKKTLRLVQKLQKTQVRLSCNIIQRKIWWKGYFILFRFMVPVTRLLIFSFLPIFMMPNRLYNCSLFDEWNEFDLWSELNRLFPSISLDLEWLPVTYRVSWIWWSSVFHWNLPVNVLK